MGEDMQLNKIKPEKLGDFDEVMDEFLPFIYLNSDQMSEIVNWKQGKKYRVVFDIVQTAQRVDSDKVVRSDFKVVAYKILPLKEIEDMDDKEFGEYQGKMLNEAMHQRETSPSMNER